MEYPLRQTCVVKVGSAVLAPDGRLRSETIDRLAGEIADLHQRGIEILLVSSGAVACGLPLLGLDRMPERISDRQAAAALGQPIIIGAWTDALRRRGLPAAQTLLTVDDIDFRERFVNAQRKLRTLLNAGAVPIINENDSVSYKDLSLGDNDRLGTLVSCLLGADLMVLLSTADGLREDKGRGGIIPVIESPGEAASHVGQSKSAVGRGGMGAKLDSAFTARDLGTTVVIATGEEPGVLARVIRGEEVGTRFPALQGGLSDMSRRKQWIAHAIGVRGRLVVDDGARTALAERGASLLPGGVIGVDAEESEGFPVGAAVEICGKDGRIFARGLVNYRYDEIVRITGVQSGLIEAVLGYSRGDEIIHRDDLVLTPTPHRV